MCHFELYTIDLILHIIFSVRSIESFAHKRLTNSDDQLSLTRFVFGFGKQEKSVAKRDYRFLQYKMKKLFLILIVAIFFAECLGGS